MDGVNKTGAIKQVDKQNKQSSTLRNDASASELKSEISKMHKEISNLTGAEKARAVEILNKYEVQLKQKEQQQLSNKMGEKLNGGANWQKEKGLSIEKGN